MAHKHTLKELLDINQETLTYLTEFRGVEMWKQFVYRLSVLTNTTISDMNNISKLTSNKDDDRHDPEGDARDLYMYRLKAKAAFQDNIDESCLSK